MKCRHTLPCEAASRFGCFPENRRAMHHKFLLRQNITVFIGLKVVHLRLDKIKWNKIQWNEMKLQIKQNEMKSNKAKQKRHHRTP